MQETQAPPNHSRNTLQIVQGVVLPTVSYDRVMLWAACCTGFFGFLHSGEFTCPPSAATLGYVLLVSDVAVDSHSNTSFASVHLRHNKMDILGVGATVFLGQVDGQVCPVKALLAYLALQGPAPRPLFVFQNGCPISRVDLVRTVRFTLE